MMKQGMTRLVRKLAAVVMATGMSAAVTGANAQQPPAPLDLRVDYGVYVGAGVGRSKTEAFCGGTCDTYDRTWNAFVGYQLNRHLAFELGYVDLGQFTVSGTITGVPVTSVYDMWAIELSGVGLLPLTDRFSIFGKLGLFRYDSEANTTGVVVGDTGRRDTSYTLGIGAQYAFTRNLAARLEWQSYADVGAAVPGNFKADVRLWRLVGTARF